MPVDSLKQPGARRDVTSFDDSELLEIGYIGKAHGLRGELRLTLHNSESDALDCTDRLVVKQQGVQQLLTLTSVRGGTNPVLVCFEGVESRDGAEQLKGATAFVLRCDMPPLEAGEYYLSDLVGAQVVGPAGDVGVVTELALYPTVDSLVIADPTGKRLEQPLVEPWVESVDARAKVIRLRSLDGIIE